MQILDPRLAVRLFVIGLVLAPAARTARDWCRTRAATHREAARRHHDLAWHTTDWPGRGCVIRSTPRSEYHKAMQAKHERAAFVPWVPIPPDPTQPAWAPPKGRSRRRVTAPNGKPGVRLSGRAKLPAAEPSASKGSTEIGVAVSRCWLGDAGPAMALHLTPSAAPNTMSRQGGTAVATPDPNPHPGSIP